MSAVDSSNRISAFEVAQAPKQGLSKAVLRKVLMIGGVAVVACVSQAYFLSHRRTLHRWQIDSRMSTPTS